MAELPEDTRKMIERIKKGERASGAAPEEEIERTAKLAKEYLISPEPERQKMIEREQKRRKVMRLAELYEKEQRGEGTEEVRREIDALVAELLPEEHSNPVSEHCREVLASPPDCYSFRAMRSYASCLGWKYMDEERIPWREAIRKAWLKAKEACKAPRII